MAIASGDDRSSAFAAVGPVRQVRRVSARNRPLSRNLSRRAAFHWVECVLPTRRRHTSFSKEAIQIRFEIKNGRVLPLIRI
jgi:hypothetical protein